MASSQPWKNKRIEVSLHAAAKAQAARTFKQPMPGEDDEGNADRLAPRSDKSLKDKGQKDKREKDKARQIKKPELDAGCFAPPCRFLQPSLRPHATSRATELMRVGENRRECANPTLDPGGCRYTVQKQLPTPRFNQGVPLHDATRAQLEFVNRELARFVQAGAWGPSPCCDYVSRFFLVPKPGNNQWWLICDLRTKQLLRSEATQDGDAILGQAPNKKGIQNVQLRPT
jgi:hypothetical protein